MRKKNETGKAGGSETPERRKKSIYGVTEVLGKQLSKKKQKTKQHLNHPFTVMQPFVLQHTCTRTRTPNEKNHENGERGYENYYFHVVGDRLDEIKLETTTKNPL